MVSRIERARAPHEERQAAGDDDAEHREPRAPRGVAAARLPRDDAQERHGDDGELLEQDRRAEGDRRPAEPPPRDEPEREHERRERERVGRPEPGRADRQRVHGEHGAEHEPHPGRPGKRPGGGQHGEAREADEEADVVERRGQQPPGRRDGDGARQVGEVAERRVRLGRRRAAAVARVDALHPGVAVVVAVGVRPVEHEVAREIDLVRRVVVVEPRCRRVAQPRLQRDGGHEQRHGDDDRRDDRDRPAGAPEPGHGDEQQRDQQPGAERGSAQHPDVPAAVRGAHERPEQPVRVHRARPSSASVPRRARASRARRARGATRGRSECRVRSLLADCTAQRRPQMREKPSRKSVWASPAVPA